MSEMGLLLDEIRALKRRLQALETMQEHPGFAASDMARKSLTLAQFAATTSAQLAGIISDETGTGALVFANTPTLVTPVLGVATATSINKVAFTAPATSATLTIADGKTLTVNQTLTLTGASGKTLTLTDSLTVQGGGAITLSSAGVYTLTLQGNVTIPAGTTAMLGTANTFTEAQTVRKDQNAETSIVIYNNTTGTGAVAGIRLRRQESGQVLMSLNNSTYTGISNYENSFVVDAGIGIGGIILSAADSSGVIRFYTGGRTTERMRISSTGNVGIGDSAPTGKLHIDQSSTTAAIPVLKLDQADVSEGFIDYIGTSAASAAGPISTWTNATLAGFVRCEVNGAAYWQPYYNAPTS